MTISPKDVRLGKVDTDDAKEKALRKLQDAHNELLAKVKELTTGGTTIIREAVGIGSSSSTTPTISSRSSNPAVAAPVDLTPYLKIGDLFPTADVRYEQLGHIPKTYVVNDLAGMLSLSGAVVGDFAIRKDQSKSYILTALPSSTSGSWKQLALITFDAGDTTPGAPYLPLSGGWVSGPIFADMVSTPNIPGFAVGQLTTGMYSDGLILGLTRGANSVLVFDDDGAHFETPIQIPSPAAPASSGAAGLTGQIRYDVDFLYIAVGTNNWVRFAKDSTWAPPSGFDSGFSSGFGA